MKAAVLHEIGGVPRYQDFPDPVAGDDEVVLDVKAVAVENVDKRIAAGTHYASRQYTAQLPAIPAFDGIGARHGIREVLVARDATDLVQHGRLHHSSRPKNAAIRRCQATSTRGGRAVEW